MTIQLEHPNEAQLDQQLSEIIELIAAEANIDHIEHPATFIEGWLSGALKVFTNRDTTGKLRGVNITAIIKCPLRSKRYYRQEVLQIGERFDEFVEAVLSVYGNAQKL